MHVRSVVKKGRIFQDIILKTKENKHDEQKKKKPDQIHQVMLTMWPFFSFLLCLFLTGDVAL